MCVWRREVENLVMKPFAFRSLANHEPIARVEFLYGADGAGFLGAVLKPSFIGL